MVADWSRSASTGLTHRPAVVTVGAVRWQALFADLDAQFDAAEAADLAAEVSDRTRLELARVRLVDRLRAAVGEPVVVVVPHLGPVHGQLAGFGPDWVLLTESPSREALLPMGAVSTVSGLGPTAAEPGDDGAIAARLGLRYALRLLARDRSVIAVTVTDGRTLTGTLERVGADFVEVAEHPSGEVRRGAGRALTVPFGAIVVIRST